MSKPYLQLGGDHWAAKDGKILGFAQGDNSGKYLAREFTFTRGDNIDTTRVTKDGLIEKGRENLVTKSNVFGTGDSNWTKAGVASVAGGQAGYDGTNDAWKVTSVSSASGSRVYKTQNAVSEIETWSIHVKAGNVKWCRLNLSNSGNVYFDLENGEVGTATANVFGAIEDKGNGWYRCSMTTEPGATNHTGPYIFLATADGTLSTDADNFIYIQDAQLERGQELTDYIESGATTGKAGISEDLPRIDYTNGTAQFILEPSRTNLVLHSEGNHVMGGSATRTFKPDEVSPTGYKGGVVEVSNLSGAAGDRFQFLVDIADSLPSEVKTWTGSLFMKGTPGEKIDYYVKRANEGEIEQSPIGTATFDGTWQRFSATFTNDTDNDEAGFFLTYRSSSTADKVLIWGRQFEEGPCVTSYIPTYGATATRTSEGRNLEDLKIELPSQLSLAYTLFMDFEVEANESTSDYQDVLYFGQLADGTKEAVKIETFSDGGEESVRVFVYKADGTTQATSTGNASGSRIEFGTRAKVAVRVDDSAGIKIFYNGSSIKSLDTAQAYSHVKYIMATEADGSIRSKTLINEIRTYSTALTDTECETLTTI